MKKHWIGIIIISFFSLLLNNAWGEINNNDDIKREASILWKNGQLQNALKLYESALSHNVDDLDSLLSVGYLYFELQKYKKALFVFENFLDKQEIIPFADKQIFEIYHALAICSDKIGDKDREKYFLDKWFKLQHDSLKIPNIYDLVNIVNLYWEIGEEEKAIDVAFFSFSKFQDTEKELIYNVLIGKIYSWQSSAVHKVRVLRRMFDIVKVIPDIDKNFVYESMNYLELWEDDEMVRPFYLFHTKEVLFRKIIMSKNVKFLEDLNTCVFDLVGDKSIDRKTLKHVGVLSFYGIFLQIFLDCYIWFRLCLLSLIIIVVCFFIEKVLCRVSK